LVQTTRISQISDLTDCDFDFRQGGGGIFPPASPNVM